MQGYNATNNYMLNEIQYIGDYFPYGKVLREYVNGDKELYLTTQHERDNETGLDYRGARYYDSDVARFLSLDPHASKYASWSAYNYTLANPIRWVDMDGKDPGDPFESIEAAALDFSNIFGAMSIQEGREYGAYIYSQDDGEGNITYSYALPDQGKGDNIIYTVPIPEGAEKVGKVHSHGAVDPDKNTAEYSTFKDNFSDRDMKNANREGVQSYITTPEGYVKLYILGSTDEEGKTISTNSPSDVNSDANVNTNYAIPASEAKGKTTKEMKKIWKKYRKENAQKYQEYAEKYIKLLQP